MWPFGHSFVKTNVMKYKSQFKDDDITDFFIKKNPSDCQYFSGKLFLIFRMLHNSHFTSSPAYLIPIVFTYFILFYQ